MLKTVSLDLVWNIFKSLNDFLISSSVRKLMGIFFLNKNLRTRLLVKCKKQSTFQDNIGMAKKPQNPKKQTQTINAIYFAVVC